MIKKVERSEVLQRVRFSNKFLNKQSGLIYKNNEPVQCDDLEIIRYDKQSWVEVQKNDDNVLFTTVEDYLDTKNLYPNLIRIEIKDLVHMTDCGYGFLKGVSK